MATMHATPSVPLRGHSNELLARRCNRLSDGSRVLAEGAGKRQDDR
jgi:hypothetical protein